MGSVENGLTKRSDVTNIVNFRQFKGRNSEVHGPICLVILLWRDIMPCEFHEDPIKNVWL